VYYTEIEPSLKDDNLQKVENSENKIKILKQEIEELKNFNIQDFYYTKIKDLVELDTKSENILDGEIVKYASVDNLIKQIIIVSHIKNMEYITTFLTTYKSFISPKELVKKLKILYDLYIPNDISSNQVKLLEFVKKDLHFSRSNLVVFLLTWVSKFYHDFDEELIQEFFDFSRIMFISKFDEGAQSILQALSSKQV
jgi:hypothetical protein